MIVAVCDDNGIHLDKINRCLQDIPALSGATFHAFRDSQAMIDLLEEGRCKPDIAVLDINMECSGIDVAERINRRYPKCQIIFITGYLEYAPEVYDVEHTYLVLKSELNERLEKAVAKAIGKLEAEKSRQIVVAYKGETILLQPDDVSYIERRGRITIVHSASGEHQAYARPNELMGEYQNEFLRSHHSFFVNRAWIRSVNKEQIVLRGGETVPMSRTYAPAVRKTLLVDALTSGER